MIKHLFSNKAIGFTEIIIAALIITMGFVAYAILFMSSTTQLQKSTKQLQAVYLASEGIEVVREAIKADLNVANGWTPEVTIDADNWYPLNYWVPAGTLAPPLTVGTNSTRFYRIVDRTVCGAWGSNPVNMRCIDVMVNGWQY
jgi:hypothetical protein